MPEGVFISPQLVSQSLSGITHRFVLILECETRHYDEAASAQGRYAPPRFCVGGPRANQDPRIVPVRQLIGITNANRNDIQIPPGWEKVHQYIYVLHGNTDDHGWQYRSDWSEGVLEPQDEQWTGVHTDQHEVRRRIWMTTVVKRDDLIRAKRILSESLQRGSTGDVLSGILLKLDQGYAGKSWQKRSVRLRLDNVEFFNGEVKTGDMSLSQCEVKMLHSSQCPGKDFAFTVRNLSGNMKVIIDAGHKETRRRWVVAIGYQIAIHWPEVNFPPFDYGPPTGDDAHNRVLICGDLQKQGHLVKNWKSRYFQLTPRELQYFEKDLMKGKISIEEAALKYDDRSLDFTVRGASGAVLVMRTDNQVIKTTWIRSLERAIQALKDVKIAAPTLSEKELEELREVHEVEAVKAQEIEAAKQKATEDEAAQLALEASTATTDASTVPSDIDAGEEPELEPDLPAPSDYFTEASEPPMPEETVVVSEQVQSTSAEEVSSPSKAPEPEAEEFLEEEDENEELVDPYLQFGGAYEGDKKDTDSFKYISFTELPRFTPDHKSLLAKHLTLPVFQHLASARTSTGYSLSNAIMSGVVIPNLAVGVTAGDEESWGVFGPLFDPIISELHRVDLSKVAHVSDFDDSKLVITEAQATAFGEFISATRIRASRNLSRFPLPAGITDSERAEVESTLAGIFESIGGDFVGKYHPLSSIGAVENENLIKAKMLYQIPAANDMLTGAGGARSWPSNRGIFLNPEHTALAWVNEEDHTCLMAAHPSAGIKEVFAHFAAFDASFSAAVESNGFKIMKSEKLGYLVTSPSNLGSALHASVTIKLPCLNRLMASKKKSENSVFQKVCDVFSLKVQGSNGLYTSAEGANFDVSTQQRLGQSEVKIVQSLIDGVYAIIEVERKLVGGATVDQITQFIKNGCRSTTGAPLRAVGSASNVVPASAGAVIDTNSYLPSTLRRTSVSINSPARETIEEEEEEDEADEFGMKDISISESVQARMMPSLVKKLNENPSKRSSYVLAQIAKHEAYFDKTGVDKNAPSLGNKKTYYKFK